jgi:hypothetical protein
MPFRPAPSRRGHNVTQTGIAISRVLADRGSADQLAHADPALRVPCPVCEALSHQRCLERNPKQYVTPHAERAALVTGTASEGTFTRASIALLSGHRGHPEWSWRLAPPKSCCSIESVSPSRD